MKEYHSVVSLFLAGKVSCTETKTRSTSCAFYTHRFLKNENEGDRRLIQGCLKKAWVKESAMKEILVLLLATATRFASARSLIDVL